MCRRKLGFDPDREPHGASADSPEDLFLALEKLLASVETDMTLFFRQLARVDLTPEFVRTASDQRLIEPLLGAYYQAPEPDTVTRVASWVRRYAARFSAESGELNERVETMDAVNPRYVLRNYMAQLAIDDAEQGDFSLVRELLDVLRRPYEDQPGRERFATRRPEWARSRPGCSMLSCSS
jgi:uncharacterized protein YdiU (UPF0061 family)